MTRAVPTSCSPPLSRKTLATEPGFSAMVQRQRKEAGVNWVEGRGVNVGHRLKAENFGMRRSNKMAEGLFCIANAKPCSGSPVSMISYKSERLSRNKRRIASSSSITSSFCIASSPYGLGLWFRIRVSARKNRCGSGGLWFFLCGIAFCIQKLPHLARESLLSEGFVQQVRAGFKHAVTGYEAIGVSGHVEHFHPWLTGGQAFPKNGAIHSGHDDIGEQQVNGAGVLPRGLQRLLTIGGTQNAVAALLQEHLGKFAQRLGVFYHQDRFCPSCVHRCNSYRRDSGGDPLVMPRQVNRERRAVPFFRIH